MNTRNPFSRLRTALICTLLLPAAALLAQDGTSTMSNESDTYFSNPLFLVLLLVIIMLLGIVFALSNMVKSAAYFNIKVQAQQKAEGRPFTDGSSWNFSYLKWAIIVLTGLAFASIPYFFLDPFTTKAGEAAAVAETSSSVGRLSAGIFWSMLGIIVVELVAVALLYWSGIRLLRTERRKKTAPATKEEKQAADAQMPAFLERFNASVAIEHEKDILLDHNYDGIRELDNNLPPWWKFGFYLTVVWSVVYLVHYHVIKTGNLQEAEYNAQVAQAEADLAAYRAKAANFVDETNVTLLHNTDSLAQGKSLFLKTQCPSCHGENGEGIVGPNLTDDFWLNGGDIKSIFKTIKLGVLGKGMKSWQNELSPAEMQMVASYIKSLRGTQPANAKAAEGTLYKEEGAAPVPDSAAAANDSAPKADSAAKQDSAAKKK